MIQDKADVRMKALVALSTSLFPSVGRFAIRSFVHLQTLFQALFALRGSLLAEGDSKGASYILELIDGVRKVAHKGGLGGSMLIQQYEIKLRSEADTQAILDFAVIMALAACLENAMQGEHRYILHHLTEMTVSMSYLSWAS
jgi:hypothetical protein